MSLFEFIFAWFGVSCFAACAFSAVAHQLKKMEEADAYLHRSYIIGESGERASAEVQG